MKMSTHTKTSKGSKYKNRYIWWKNEIIQIILSDVALEIQADKFPKLQENDHVLLRRICTHDFICKFMIKII